MENLDIASLISTIGIFAALCTYFFDFYHKKKMEAVNSYSDIFDITVNFLFWAGIHLQSIENGRPIFNYPKGIGRLGVLVRNYLPQHYESADSLTDSITQISNIIQIFKSRNLSKFDA